MEDKYKADTRILRELEQLSESLDHQPRAARRNASLALPRNAAVSGVEKERGGGGVNPKPRSRRMSLSPWRTRGKPELEESDDREESRESSKWEDDVVSEKKKGIWNWKPIRAITHIAMQKLSCLFSVEVVAAQNLPPSMNGLRLAVCVRKKESKDGAVQTMPSRVSDGAADFEETLFIRCNVYFTPGTGVQLKFEPRPFLIYLLAVDAPELDFGRSGVDLTNLIQDSVKKSFEGARVKQSDTIFSLSGKAKGGELVIKLGFQIMEKDGGFDIFRQGEKPAEKAARNQSKTSFSVMSPRLASRAGPWSPNSPSQKPSVSDLQEIDDLNLDEPAPAPVPQPQTSNPKNVEEKPEEHDFPEFDIEDKGVEIEVKRSEEEDEGQSEESFSDKRSVSSEVVKEVVVQDQSHLKRLSELDSIALQIKALESMMEGEKTEKTNEGEAPLLDADEDKVTREFLQLLEDDVQDKEDNEIDLKHRTDNSSEEVEVEVLISDLGKGLGCIVQTRNGGFLAAMNPLETPVGRKDTPKLAMQLTKPLVVTSEKASGFEIFQKMASVGMQKLTSEILSAMPLDELMGKTAEQIAFEGIASAIIVGRNKEGASSSAARTISAVKSMANAMTVGRKDRISSGIWSVSEDPLTADEILPFSIQKIESMALEALKIQAEATEEEAPFDVSPHLTGKVSDDIFASAVPVEDLTDNNTETMTIAVVIQLRDPLRQYEAVGGPMIALIQVTAAGEEKYKVGNLQIGGIKVRNQENKNSFDGGKQELTALQWLVAYGFVKGGKKGKRPAAKGSDVLWSLTARVMADMWLKPIRNPDVKFS